MAKLTLKTIGSGFLATQAIDENFSDIETFLDTLLSRDGAAPNTMLDTLDMNSNRIINTTDPVNLQDVATKNYVDSILASGIADQAGNAGLFLTTDGSTTSWADPLPDQTSQAGNFLTTDGSVASWAGGDFLPSPLVANRLVSNDGATPSWRLDFLLTANTLAGDDANAGALLNAAASTTVPTVVGDKTDTDSGLTSAGADIPGVVAGGVLGIAWAEASSGVLQRNQMITGITANPVQVQGNTPLFSSYNEISTVVNNGDVVTLPAAVVGQQVTLVNNGANNLQVFPASGEDLGAGVDTSTTLSPGGTLQLLGTASMVYAQAFNLGLFGDFTDAQFCAANANGPCMQNEASSQTNPTFVPDKTGPNSGLGGTVNFPALIANSRLVAQFSESGAAVNYLTLTSTATGFGPTLSVSGSGTGGDADIDLNIAPGGAGALNLAAGISATPTAAGGNVVIQGGPGGVTSGDGGDVSLISGAPTAGDGGDVIITATAGTVTDGIITLGASGAVQFALEGSILRATQTAGGALINEVSSATNPTVVPRRDSPATGMGGDASNLSLIIGGTEIIDLTTTLATFRGTTWEGSNAAGPVLLNEAASSTNPTVAPNKADPDTGIGWFASNAASLVANGTHIAFWTDSTGFSMSQANGAQLRNENASETNPTLIPDRSEGDSGMGIWANNSPSIIAISEEVARFNSTAGPTAADSRWEFTPANVATDGENLILEATGTPLDITMEINAKGTGVIQIGSNLLASNATGPAIQNEASSSSNPTLVPDQTNASTGIGNTGTAVEIISNGASKLRIGTGPGQANIVFEPLSTSGLFIGSVSGSFGLHNLAASATVPTLLPSFLDESAGVGIASGHPYIIANDTSVAEFADNGTAVNRLRFTNAPTGLGPTIDVAGEVNVDLNLNTAGTGDLVLQTGGAVHYTVVQATGFFEANNANGPALQDVAAALSTPTVLSDKSATTSGMGFLAASNSPTIISAGTWQAAFGVTGAAIRANGDIDTSFSNGPFLVDATGTAAAPNVVPNKSDPDTGHFAGNDTASIAAGGILAVEWQEVSSSVIEVHQIDTGIAASTTQTQGQQPLDSSYNDVATVANANDVVTLPAAQTGAIVAIHNAGANVLQIFPASGDAINAGAVDASTTLAVDTGVTYMAIDATTWKSI